MTRLDQNRAAGQIALQAGVPVAQVRDLVIWGNHSPKMYPDPTVATVGGEAVTSRLSQDWLRGAFLDTVSTRGKAIIGARGASSAASAASAAVDHMADWWKGTGDRIVSMAQPSKGWYGVPEGLVFSFPCRVNDGVASVVEDVPLDDFARAKIAENVADLQAEKDAVADLLG
jgi:malate dehydrogenase